MEELKGHRNSIKVLILYRTPMSDAGFANWDRHSKIHINKSRFVFKYFSSSKDMKHIFPETQGRVPVEHLANQQAIADWFLDSFPVTEKVVYYVYGWTHRKSSYEVPGTGKRVGISGCLCRIQVLNAEKRIVKVFGTRRLGSYWFWDARRAAQRRREENQGYVRYV